ncbi:MAG: hypothetical protein U1C73_20980, partial [Dietzia sp.]|nr:hypothetical protein [Dietzia sp.]
PRSGLAIASTGTASALRRLTTPFQLDDSAQRAMLRPEGTAGWAFDLPPLTKVAVAATTVAPVPAAGQPPAATTPAANAPVTVTQTVESDA